jgi:C_GCAxxG_C_C family probable redox protein
MTKSEKAQDYFSKGFSCSQAVCAAFATDFGITEETALKITSAFGGGCGRLGLTCGAVTGAYCVIGLKFGRGKNDGDSAKEKTYETVGKFSSQFMSKNGSLNCTELLGHNIGIADERKKAGEAGLFRTVCPKLVKDACEILERVLEE